MISYRFASDEVSVPIDIMDLTPEQRSLHHFFCIGCGTEMVAVLGENREWHFRHRGESPCNGQTYLHKLAKIWWEWTFNNSKHFPVSYRAHNECSHKEECAVFQKLHPKECSGEAFHIFDLKEYYDMADQEKGDRGYIADVRLSSSTNMSRRPVFLEAKVENPCSPEKIAAGIRIIEVDIQHEADIVQPLEEKEGIRFYNFNRELHRDDLKRLIRFTLSDTGKFGLDVVSCSDALSHAPDSVFEVLLLRSKASKDEKFKQRFLDFCLAQAILQEAPIRHCRFCAMNQRCRIIPRIRKDIDFSQLASNCHDWYPSVLYCDKTINRFNGGDYFIWKA